MSKTYRVLAENVEVYEIFVEADSEQEAEAKARNANPREWNEWDDAGLCFTTGFDVISGSAEEYEG